MEAVALYGGSFDPPHTGHYKIVDALTQLEYIDKVVVMPTYLNPFKSSYCASPQLRLQWLRSLFASYKNVEVSSFEIDLNREVPTIETVEHLKTMYSKIYLVIGADNVNSLHNWHNYEALKKLVSFIVVTRENFSIPKEFITLKVQEDVSSSQLRQNMQSEKIPKTLAKEISKFYKEYNAKQNTKNNRLT